jgi:DNA/RNA-binding domain of Phe-tRNA-synthetase-like protein
MQVIIEQEIREACPDVKIGLIRADVVNSETPDELWTEIEEASKRIRESYELSWINKRPAIVANRNLYKRMGKDPNRYRVSSEALCRRVVKGLELYRINALVDLINLVSMCSGYSIGGFDADKIVGDTVTLGVGRSGEKFEGIGRGLLNVEGLPLYRDAAGGIGSPTSDEERTKITLETTRLQMQINAFGEEMPLDDTIEWSVSLLEKYTSAKNVQIDIF